MQLPSWVADCLSPCMQLHAGFDQLEKRMDFVIHLAKKNVEQQTGGPFAAAIFHQHTHQLLAVGVNMVVPSCCSIHHAEMVAITLAQQSLQCFNLKEHGEFELVTSCEPCAMCFGALPWSGITHVVCGATSADAEAIGFDEGPKHPQWVAELEQRGIAVTCNVRQPQAAQVLQDYQHQQGNIYNG